MVWVALFIILVAAFNALFLSGKLPWIGTPHRKHRPAPAVDDTVLPTASKDKSIQESRRITVPCHHCRAAVRIPEGQSGYVRCPKCDQRFFVQAESDTKPDVEAKRTWGGVGKEPMESDMFSDDIFFKISSKKHVLPILWVAAPLLVIVVTGLMAAGTFRGIYWGLLPRLIFVGIPLATLIWLVFAGWGRRESRSYYVRLRIAKISTFMGWAFVLLPLGNAAPMSPPYIALLLASVIMWTGMAAAISVPFFLYKSRNIRFNNRVLGGRKK